MDSTQLGICLLLGVIAVFVFVAFLRSIFGAKLGERISAALIGLASLLLTLFSPQHIVPNWVIPIAGAVLLLVLFVGSRVARDALLESVYDSDDVADYALKHFDSLDIDRDGVVSDDDLLKILNEVNPVPDPAIVELLRRDLPHAGHVVRRHVVVVPSAAGSGLASIPVYGVSREDLRSYPQRIRTLFEAEYGEAPLPEP